MEFDERKVEEAVLALLYLTLHDGNRAWKTIDFAAIDRLQELRVPLRHREQRKIRCLHGKRFARGRAIRGQAIRQKLAAERPLAFGSTGFSLCLLPFL